MDEVFGPSNFVAAVIWQKVYSPKNSAKHFSEDHDYVVVHARDAEKWKPNLVPRAEKQDKAYKNPDNDPRGPWKPSGLDARNPYSKGTYSITCPSGRTIPGPPKGAYWRYSEEKFKELDVDSRIWWGKEGNSIPQLKRFLREVKQGVVPQTLWTYQEVGHTQEAKQELVAICEFPDSASVFITPKPTRLIRRILAIASDPEAIVMDSFAGSGSTGHAVMAANAADGGRRQFILVELDHGIARNVARQRLTRVCSGYTTGEGTAVAALGSGFRYCRLGRTLLDEQGNINGDVPFADLARYAFLLETGVPMAKRPRKDSALLGVHRGRAVYLLYNGVLGDKRAAGGNVLTNAVLAALPPHPEGVGPRVIFGEACRLSEATLNREGITFRHVPYALREA